MTTEDNILQEVHKNNYVTVKSSKINPSYYKLKDGTIISTSIIPSYFLEETPTTLGGGTTNVTNAYIPKKLREPSKFKKDEKVDFRTRIIERDLDFDTLKEDFSNFKLSNGVDVKIKAVATQVDKTDVFNPAGERIYLVNVQPIFKVKGKRSIN